jgi:tripartite-type tricarboxylate transporter receptor subunit TctC
MKHALRFSLLLIACTAFAADDYPAKPIQMIVPFPAGGPADIVGRLYAQHLSAVVGQPVVTLNRDGASGSIGTAAAARAAPDGYTLIFGTTSTMVINPLVMKNVPYDFWKDFALIGLIANAPHILAVREGLPAKSATELVAMAKASPGKYTIASAGVGTIVQMAAELLKHETGADLLIVPFKGGQPATLALLSGEVDMIVNDLTALKSNLASGKLRALAVSAAKRLPQLPDVPTLNELGYKGMEDYTWVGIFTPAATPREIAEKLNAAVLKAMQAEDIKQRLEALAFEATAAPLKQTADYVRSEVAKWAKVVRETGAKAE